MFFTCFTDPGYGICWDNVQKQSHARYQSRKRRNQMHLWALAFIYKNRISFRHLDVNRADTIPATDLSLHRYLPDQDDWNAVRSRMEVIVQRILVQRLTHFEVFLCMVCDIFHIKNTSIIMN